MRDSLGNKVPKSSMVIRATEVGEFRNCRRKWFFGSHNGLNLEPVMRDKKLSEGICWHAGLESYYSTGDFETGFMTAFGEEVSLMQSVIGDGIYDELIQADLNARKELALTLFELYKEWSTTTAEPSDYGMETVSVEQRLLIPLCTPKGNKSRTWVAVRLDGVVKKDNIYYVLEHKYLSKSTAVDNPQHLSLDLQMGIQQWALSHYLALHDPNAIIGGALYNLTRKQMPSSRVKNPLFGRHLVHRSKTELDILVRGLYKDSQDMRATKRSPSERTYNPQPTGICTWGCAFRSVCDAMNRGGDVKVLLDNGYQKREKDIWKLLQEEMDNNN